MLVLVVVMSLGLGLGLDVMFQGGGFGRYIVV